jgi:hypothetical protein
MFFFSLGVFRPPMLKTSLLLLAAMFSCGCVVPVPATLHARGFVLDATTKKPVASARVMVQNHPRATAVTASDGSFDIPSESHWRFIVPPIEPTNLAESLVVTKPGYQSTTTNASYERHAIFLSPK